VPDVLIVFVKAPRPGAVKTRLASRLGEGRAAALYRALAEEQIRRTAPRADEYERRFFFDPPDARAELEAWLGPQAYAAQGAGDLGARLSAAFADVFAGGARRAAVIGTDVPSMSRDDVLDALQSLDHEDVAIGPATDGGYYLLALRRAEPELFRDIPWSTSGVLEATLARAAARGLGVNVLRTLGDVDTMDDLRASWSRVRPLLGANLAREIGAALDPETG
jgi:rSAM/selenodomain-associated transferase 1